MLTAARSEKNAPANTAVNLFNQAPALIAIFSGREGKVELFNPLFQKLWGDRDVVGMPMRKAWPELGGQGWFELIDGVFSTGEPIYANAYPGVADWKGDGTQSTAYFNFIGTPYREADGTISKVMVFGFEVTEQVLAKKELAETEALLQMMMNASPAAKWMSDEEGKITFVSKRWMDMTGMTFEGSQGCGWTDAVVEEERKPIRKKLMKSVEARTAFQVEFRIVDSQGALRWCLGSDNPANDEDNKFIGFVGSVIDITSLKNAEQLVYESEAQFRQMADSMPQMVWTAKPDGYLDYYNKQWYDYTGFEEGYGDNSWLPILHPDDKENCYNAWYYSVKTGTPYEIQYRFIDRKTGEYRWFLGRALPIRNAQGEIVKWFGTSTDIHQQKTVEEVLEVKVAERTADLVEANEKLAQSNEELEKFAYIASHDLQEPLRKIRFFTDMLAREVGNDLSAKAASFMDRISNASVRMMTLIDDLLGFSRLSRNEEKQLVNLNDIIGQITNDFDLLIHQRDATIRYTNLPTLKAVPQQMHQLFFNLMSNAMKFVEADKKPCIEIFGRELDDDFVEIAFSDNGIGFEAEYKERIFEIFERLNTRTEYAGTGIGLAVCRKIVARHGGTIRAESQEGEGSTFYITLPLS